GPLRPEFAPWCEERRVALALGMDELAQKGAVAIAHAVAGEPHGKFDEISFDIARIVWEGSERRIDAGIGALGHVLHHRGEELLLVAIVIVDGLARDLSL